MKKPSKRPKARKTPVKRKPAKKLRATAKSKKQPASTKADELKAAKLRKEEAHAKKAELELARLEQSVKDAQPKSDGPIKEVLLDPSFYPDLQPNQRAFLAIFAATGHVGKAAGHAEIHRGTHYEWLKDDYYRAAYKECEKLAAELLQSECFRRANEGTDRPVYQAGVLVGYVTEYSDTLAMFLLKGLMPDRYKDRARIEWAWDGNPESLTDQQLEQLTQHLEKIAFGGDPQRLEEAKQRLARERESGDDKKNPTDDGSGV